MRQGNGTELPGMGSNDPRAASVGVIYVSPSDDRKSVLAAILTQEKLGRKQVAVVLPNQNKAFQRPQDFDDLKSVRRRLQSDIVFIVPPGPGPAEFARQRRFPVYSTLESFVDSLQDDGASGGGARRRGLFHFRSKAPAAPAAGAAAAGAAASAASADKPTDRSQRPVSGRYRTLPLPQSDQTAQDDDALDDRDEHRGSGASAAAAGAAGVGAGLLAADLLRSRPGGDVNTAPPLNLQDDQDSLPPIAATPASTPPTTPDASSQAGAPPHTPATQPPDPADPAAASGPGIIELPRQKRITGKMTNAVGPVPASADATGRAGSATPGPRSTQPRRNSDKGVAAGAAVAGAAVGAAAGALAASAGPGSGSGTAGNAATGSARGARNVGGAPPPARAVPVGSGGNYGRRPRRRLWLLALIALLLLTLLVSGGIYAFANPNVIPAQMRSVFSNPGAPQQADATITITPDSKLVQDSYNIIAVKGQPDAKLHQVGGLRTVTFTTPVQTKKVTGTGHKQTAGVPATGKIKFTNGAFAAYSIGATTFKTASGIAVITDPVTVPAAMNGSNGTIIGGTITTTAHAVNPGASGNIPAKAINQACCNSLASIFAINESAFTGGQDPQNYSFIQQDDVNAVVSPLKDNLLSLAQKGVKDQMKPEEQLATDIQCDDLNRKADQQIGDTGGTTVTSATLSISQTCHGIVYNHTAAQDIVKNLLTDAATKSPGPGYGLVGNVVTDSTVQAVTADRLSLLVNARGVWAYQFTDAIKHDLLTKLAGKSVSDARDILKASKGVGDASVHLSSGTTLPSDIGQISLQVQSVQGATGGGTSQPAPAGTPTPGSLPSQSSISGAKGLVPLRSLKG